MRHSLFAAVLIVMLGVTAPVQAQLRTEVAAHETRTRLYDFDRSGFSLNSLFDPAHFRMSHSLEFTAGSYGGASSSMGMYTNTMMWQFNRKVAARLDVSMAYSPYSDDRLQGLTGGNSGRVFIRNAEVAYRPSENTRIHLSFRQSPYGYYASPYGSSRYGGSGYGYRGWGGAGFDAGFRTSDRDLFWNDR